MEQIQTPEQQQQQDSQPRQARPKSKRSQLEPRARTPSQLLARRQQLLGAAGGALNLGPGAEPGHERQASATRLESLASELANIGHSGPAPDAQLPDAGSEARPGKSLDSVYILLAKKEKDLQLAAELGKALLERNDELSKTNERLAEEYSQKLELANQQLLEQDKHKLKRKLDLLDGEYENRLLELQADCNILKNQLDQQQQISRQVEKDKSKLIDDLVQQNQRLTVELAEATKSEEQLSSQLEQVNERISSRLSNRQDHVAQVDGLQEEIRVLNQRKQDLERRLKLAQGDKAALGAALAEAADKAGRLEALLGESETRLGELALEADELRDSGSWLAAKLDSMIGLNERLAGAGGQDSAQERERLELQAELRELRLERCARLQARRLAAGRGRRRGPRRRQASGSMSSLEDHDDRNDRNDHDHHDHLGPPSSGSPAGADLLASAYGLLRQLQAALQLRREALQAAGGSSGLQSDDSGVSTTTTDSEEIKANDRQHEDAERWRQLVGSLKALIEEMPCASCQPMLAERRDFEQLRRAHARTGDQLRQLQERNLALEAEAVERATRLAGLEQRCGQLAEDLANCDRPKEEIVRLAWLARDQAVGRKNAAEIALARARIEAMQVSSQLMEVVQQKGELSQRLAQFEDDMHHMTQHSVRAKFSCEERADELRRLARRAELANAPSGLLAANFSAQQLLFGSGASPGAGRGHLPAVAGAQSPMRPLAQLLGLAGSSPASSAPSGAANGPTNPAASGHSASPSLAQPTTRSRFNLVRFWQRTPAPTTESANQEPAGRPTGGAPTQTP